MATDSSRSAEDGTGAEVRERAPWLASLRAIGNGLARLPRPFWWAVTAGWMALIWNLSSRTFESGPKFFLSGFLSNGFHAFLFGLLGLFVALAYAARPTGPRWPDPGRTGRRLAVAVVLVWGLIDELHQARVPARHASIFDLLTDVTGVLCVLWVATFLGRADAREGGVRKRLLLSLLFCALAASLASMEKVLLDN